MRHLAAALIIERAAVAFWLAGRTGLEYTPPGVTAARLGKLCHKLDVAGHRDRPDLLTDMLFQRLGQLFRPGLTSHQNAVRVDDVAAQVIGDTDDRGFGHRRMADETALDFRR